MDFPLNSSLIASLNGSLNSSLVLALAVALWLVWVGPYFFRRPATSAAEAIAQTATQTAAQTAAPSTAPAAVAADRPAANTIRPPASPDKGSQGIIMNNISTTPSGGGATQFQSHDQPALRPAQQAPAFRIRTGRTVLAASGLLGVLAVVVGTLLAAFTAVSWLVPAAGLAAVAAVVAMLRTIALRDRRRRMEDAFRAAMGPEPRRTQNRAAAEPNELPAPAVQAPETEPQPETVLFDRESAAVPDESPAAAAGAPARVTAEELRTEALKVAAAAVQPPARPSTTPWQPVELPKPIYVDAPKAERPAPEPIVLPETPRSLTKTPLRPTTAPAPAQAEQARPETGKINLDDVLQRRRA
ncbi:MULTISPECIES: hypothetical protein [unclassified Arthrobacter]|uniref:hypothetical protein n=1 Tax=unclassified Arthrobacter TaxID=235627 RepID=UPI001D13D601|nr:MULTISPECIES: hypothetical protein [unclassified Arthrobacter]MCC3290343.1 hypothetical protein [Arthrobacter sp. zg-Y1110]MCC3300146.1 hypothetical protein [Arthrobacter sp. zg-Y895]UWX84281.1 hypothetical protein N2K99_12425 [Arthrobacter sp. zg-Y1110]